jgi:hypothetical protein
MKSAGAVLLAAVAVLSGAACGSTSALSTAHVTRTLVHSSGSGSKTLGVFAVRGPLHVTASFGGLGEASFKIDPLSPNPDKFLNECANGRFRTTLPAFHGRVRIRVLAPATKNWSFAVRERRAT